MNQPILFAALRPSSLGQRVSGEGVHPSNVLHEAFEFIAMCNDLVMHEVDLSPYQEEAERQASNFVVSYFAMATRLLREGEDG